MTTGTETERRPPPHPATSRAMWMRKNLFPTWWDSLLTVIFGVVAVWGAVTLVQFLVTSDYTIIRVNLANFIVGRFPRGELWRPAGALVVTLAAIGFVAGVTSAAARAVALDEGSSFRQASFVENVRRQWPLLVTIVILLMLTGTWGPRLTVVVAVAAAYLAFIAGRRAPAGVRRWAWLVALVMFGVAYAILVVAGGVGWGGWGGIQLNIFLTVAGILLAFPLGLVLALGRRSSLPAVRLVSVSYIELIRGVPLITLLLMGIFAIGFFLPAGIRPGPVARVLIAITLFEAAYIAEVVRGGLQSVHHGQVEASQALGMAPWKTTRLIVLPQALRATIPAMVGQFISLFKDTTLVSLVGLFDVLTISGVANAQPAFLAQGLETVTLPFVGLLFWVGSYAMSREARRLERRLGVGER